MDHAALGRGLQAGPIIAEIVQVGAGRDGALGDRAYAIVEVGLAEVAAVNRVGAVARVLELPGIGHGERPTLAFGMGADAGRGMRRDGGRDGVKHATAERENRCAI